MRDGHRRHDLVDAKGQVAHGLYIRVAAHIVGRDRLPSSRAPLRAQEHDSIRIACHETRDISAVPRGFLLGHDGTDGLLIGGAERMIDLALRGQGG